MDLVIGKIYLNRTKLCLSATCFIKCYFNSACRAPRAWHWLIASRRKSNKKLAHASFLLKRF